MFIRPYIAVRWVFGLSLQLGLVACGSDSGAPPPPAAASTVEDTDQDSDTSGDATSVLPVNKTVSTAKKPAASAAAAGSFGTALATATPKVKIDPANLNATQINYFLTTRQGSATFQAAIANPLVAQASGVPANLASFATADAASIANLLEIPQVAAIVDQVVMTMMAQDPALASTIASVAATMPNAAAASTGTSGGNASIQITGAAPTTTTTTTTTTTSALGSTLIK